MGRFYLVADRLGWHRPAHRADMSLDCVDAAHSQGVMEWTSVLDTAQHTGLVQQWMLRTGDAPLSDEWIPAEWLLRVWDSPAMAAAEDGRIGMRARLFEIEAEPVLLARSIPVVVPELGLAGVNRFRVHREVPNWWLLGPCGREALAILTQFQSTAFHSPDGCPSNSPELSTLRIRALDVVDTARRVGAYAIARAAIDERDGPFSEHHQLAHDATIGFVLKDVWPEAPRLYEPWVRQHGLPDLGAAAQHSNLPYPAAPTL